MKHEYTNTQLQAAIDGACNEAAQSAIGFLNTLDLDPQSEVWAEETPARLDLIKSALAALPEPEPLTVDGKTPGQVAWDAGNEVQKRKFPNEPVMSWQEGDELHEQLEVAAAAVLAAFGNQSQAVEEANARAEKAEAELARIGSLWANQVNTIQKLQQQLETLESKQSLSQLRPLSEAGAVPEGCIRVRAWEDTDRWYYGWKEWEGDTHFADIRLPEARQAPATEAAEADPYAELKKAHAAGKTIEVFVKDDEYGPDRWSKKENNSWTLPPEHYRIKPAPVTFGAHGKTWTKHTPGDAMPCAREAIIQCLFADGNVWYADAPAQQFRWSKLDSIADIIGWRYADKPTPEPMSTKPISLTLAESMSLRDIFAGQALAMLADPDFNHSPEDTARLVYRIADAMLAAREVKP